MRRWLIATLLAGLVASFSWRRRTLTLDGALGATLVGSVVFTRGGLPGAVTSIAFFATSSALSRVGERRKKSSPVAQAKGAQRDIRQVLANGGVATVAIGLGKKSAFVGGLAAAGADTWATELGMLARRQPRLITSLRPVDAGTSGGVTPEGVAASVGGAIVPGLAWALLGGGWRWLPIAAIAGTGGGLFDSLLGATLQAVYRCEACAVLIEEPTHQICGGRARLIKGHPWMNNDTVNVLATLAGAAIASVLATESSVRPRTPAPRRRQLRFRSPDHFAAAAGFE